MVHQLIVQRLARADSRVFVLSPVTAFPFPRWTQTWQLQDVQKPIMYGARISSFTEIRSFSFMCCVWSGVWCPLQMTEVTNWMCDLLDASRDETVARAATVRAFHEKLGSRIVQGVNVMIRTGCNAAVAFRAGSVAMDMLNKPGVLAIIAKYC